MVELTTAEGPISSVKVFGSTIIIINDKEIAVDLLDKRSAIYSCRPVLTFGGELQVKLPDECSICCSLVNANSYLQGRVRQSDALC